MTFEGDGVHPKRLHRNHQIEIRALNVTMLSGRIVRSLMSCRSGADFEEGIVTPSLYKIFAVPQNFFG